MKVSVFGLGYLGCVSAACLLENGHTLIGINPDLRKVGSVLSAAELNLNRLIVEAEHSGRFRTTLDARSAVLESDISLICVEPSSNANGSLNLRDLDGIVRKIGAALAVQEKYHVVVVRSTVLPGTIEGRFALLLEQHSERKAGIDFGICMNPVFLRGRGGVEDFDHPRQIVIGELDSRSGDTAQRLYAGTDTHIIRTTIQTAEMLNYVNSAYHAIKITFVNEIGSLCAAHRIDGQEVMEYFCLDRNVNISASLKPGFAFGGPRLPRDLRALIHRAKEQDVDCPLLNAILPSNRGQIFRAIELVEKTHRSKVAIVGLGLKVGSADIQENPIIHFAEVLMGKGYDVKIFDENIDLTKLTDTNGLSKEPRLEHIVKLISPSLQDVIKESEVVVIANRDTVACNLEMLLRDQILIDLAGVTRDLTIAAARKYV